MGLIFWVDENKFLADLVGKVFKKKNLDFYHLESVADFSFRVIDLKPEIIVLDAETVEKNLKSLENQFREHPELQEYRYVTKGEGSTISFLQKKIGILPLPLNPFEVPGKIESFLSNRRS